MKILGISNPSFAGVTIATRAICNEYYPVPHQEHTVNVANLARSILRVNPDILVVGGWSRGYAQLVQQLNESRKFPVMVVYHGTMFHSGYFQDKQFMDEIERAEELGHVDIMGFVNPNMAKYYKEVRGKKAVFIPHSFEMKEKQKEKIRFSIGILGGNGWHKNTEGSIIVAQDFAKNFPKVDVITNMQANKPHHHFLDLLSTCSVVIHLSHLEAYSNLLQECWAQGIPTIASPASRGLILSPLLTTQEKLEFRKLTMIEDAIDPILLTERLERIYYEWSSYSDETHRLYTKIAEASKERATEIFVQLKRAYDSKSYSYFRQ